MRRALQIGAIALATCVAAGGFADAALARAPRAPAPDTSLFESYAQNFTPFAAYTFEPGLAGCGEIWADTASLLAALEIHAVDPLHALAISPGEAEPYVVHLAEQLLAHVYDPEAPGTEGACGFWRDHPDTSGAAAVLAYLLRVHGAAWGYATHEALRRMIHLPAWTFVENTKVYNKSLQHPAMQLLFGEATCHAPSWYHGWDQLTAMFDAYIAEGEHESHELHYAAYHFGQLGLLDGVATAVPNQMARALYEEKALLAAQMYLPGGQLGTIYTRWTPYFFPGEGRERALGPVVEALAVGDDFVHAASTSAPHGVTLLTAVAAARNPLPAAIKSLFLDKGDGYETWWLQRFALSLDRVPGAIASVGEGGTFAHAAHFNVLPGGEAAIGTSYGIWSEDTGNKEGAAVRCTGCEQGFAFTYQWQANTPIDTDDSGALILAEPGTPQQAKASGYDAERMQVHRTRISLFDPRSRTSRWPAHAGVPVVRGDERSLAYLTNWDHAIVAGEKIFPTAGGWYVGRVGGVFIAYRPLGSSVQVSQIDGERLDGGTNVDYATLFELDGRSGGVTVLATADEFSGTTLADFAAEMDARYWSFTAAGPNDGPVAEVDYRDAGGQLCRMKLEYMGEGGLPGLERRYIDCSATLGAAYQEETQADFFAPLMGGQLISSPFVSYDTATDVLTATVPGHAPIVYDWGALRNVSAQVPIGCAGQAYLELSGPAALEQAVGPLAAVPSFELEIRNVGFGSATVAFSFEGDDCTQQGDAPNASWVVAPAQRLLAPNGSATIAVSGSAAGCSPGTFSGELVLSSVRGSFAEARFPVTLTVPVPLPALGLPSVALLASLAALLGIAALRRARR